MTSKLITYGILTMLLAGMVSCTGTKHLAEDEFLARNGEVVVVDKAKRKEISDIRMQLLKMSEVNQNSKFFWMRLRLCISNAVKEPDKEEGFRYWMKYKLGKPPVLYNPNQTERISLAMKEYLFNNSYFHSDVNFSIEERKFERKPVYSIHLGESYIVDSVRYLESGGTIDKDILTALDLHYKQGEGKSYSLERLQNHRNDLAHSLMNRGYYYFRPNYFEFIADTTNLNNKVNLTLNIKRNTPSEAFNQYRINQIYIEDNFIYDSVYQTDTQMVSGLQYMTPEVYIKPQVVANAVHLNPDSLYNRDVHMKTLSHLRALNVYKFVNIIYNKDDSLSDRLNARINLVPLSKMSFSGEFNYNVKSNKFSGPGVIFSFTNRNTFKSAEVLSLNFGGRFETQIGQGIKGNTSYEVRLDANLQMPRLYPFKSRRIRSRHIPVTGINFGSGLQERINWYQMVNWNTALRYNWKSSDKITQRYSPLDINLSDLLKTTEDFDRYLDSNLSVRRSFEEQFIIGMNYDFYYSKSPDRLNTPFFFGFTLDLSGNFVSGLMQATNAPKTDGAYRVFDLPYSQYVRSIIDIRKSFELWPKYIFATRFVIAGGYPYGNSEVMPYIKQFNVGGANSLRGFIARSVGPGTYKYESEDNIYVDQAGDLKLEMNFEYRFPVWGNLHSAIFTDVGNIWLVNEDENRPGGKFDAEYFLNELAVSSGIGLRYEIAPIIIRFDWAWPMRYPYKIIEEDNKTARNWVVKDIKLKSPSWRKENIILNISLGYPF